MNRPPEVPHRWRGYTLIELLGVLALVGILATLGLGAGRSMVDSLRLSSTTNDLVAALLAARSEAVKRKSRVVVCKSADGLSCAASGGWEQGWIVFHDKNNNAVREASEPMLHRVEALPAGWRVAGNLHLAKYVSYDANGTTKTISGAFQAGTFTICRQNQGNARLIVINSTGRARVQKVSLSSCA